APTRQSHSFPTRRSSDLSFEVKLSTDFGDSYTTLLSVPNDGTTGWQYLQLDLSDYAGEAIRIQVDAVQGGSADYYVAFDDFYLRSEEHTSELQSRENLVC